MKMDRCTLGCLVVFAMVAISSVTIMAFPPFPAAPRSETQTWQRVRELRNTAFRQSVAAAATMHRANLMAQALRDLERGQ